MEDEIVSKIKKLGKGRVKFIILFGSVAQGKSNKFSDVDLAVYYDGSKKERFNFLIKLAGMLPNRCDVKTFQDLPLYIQKDVLKGKLIYAKNEFFVYGIAYETIKKFEDFKKGYYDYINLERIK